MDLKEKEAFINSLINCVRDGMIIDLSKVPEEWSGIQLRMWISERFARQVITPSEKRSFNNDLTIYNL